MAFCLPKDEAQKFLEAVNSGTLNPYKLKGLDSADRRAEIGKVLGEDTAKEVNALFEKKLLQKEWMKGLDNWVKEVSGAWDKDVRKSAIDKISSLDERILNPKTKESFLADLAAEKLGFNLTPDQAKEIFDMTKQAQKLQDAWEKTLGQNIPRRAVNDPVRRIREAYGRSVIDLQDKVESMKPNSKTWGQYALDAALAPKTVETGIFHLSALGVQGWGILSRAQTWEAAYKQFRYFMNEDSYKNLMAYIVSHPNSDFALKAGLRLRDVSDQISNREEAIQSSVLQNINTYAANKLGEMFHPDGKPLPINVVGASSRAFTGFLNYARFNLFDTLIESAKSTEKAEGRILDPESQIVKDIGSVVNNFSGSSNIGAGDKYSNIQPILNALYFAPRKIGATIQMFNPQEYARLYYNGYKNNNYTAANAAVRNLTGSLVVTAAVLGTAKMLGFGVDYHPNSQDFLKVVLPSGEKLDMTGGNAIWVRLIARLMMNKEVTARGKTIDLGEGYKPVTRADLVSQYIRGKLSPTTGNLADGFVGSDAIGRPFSIPNELEKDFEPILMSSFLSYYHQNPNKALSDIPILSSMFGVQVESPLPPPAKLGMNTWGEPVSPWFEQERTGLDTALDKIGVIPHFPGDTINGVKLTSQQERLYIQTYGNMNKQRLSNLVESEWFQSLPLNQQRMKVKLLDGMSKTFAQNAVILQARGSSNDIFEKANENHRNKYLGEVSEEKAPE